MSSSPKNSEQDQETSKDTRVQDTPPKESDTPQTLEKRTGALALSEEPSELLASEPTSPSKKNVDQSSPCSETSSGPTVKEPQGSVLTDQEVRALLFKIREDAKKKAKEIADVWGEGSAQGEKASSPTDFNPTVEPPQTDYSYQTFLGDEVFEKEVRRIAALPNASHPVHGRCEGGREEEQDEEQEENEIGNKR